MASRRISKILTYGILSLAVFLVLLPIYVTIITALKPSGKSMRNFLTPPSSLFLNNFQVVLSDSSYWRSLSNTLLITTVVLFGNIAVMPMLSYAVTRSMPHSKVFRFLYFYLLIGLFIPFQVKMIPLVKLMNMLNMATPLGLAILCIGSNTCESVFLYVGYMQSLPQEIEEAAYIDGASTAQTFYQIVMPLLKPILATALIKESLWIWNDYMLPLIILSRNQDFTLTLYAYNYQTIDLVDYGTTFACYLLQMAPMMIFFIFAQRHIIGGLTAGAVKS